MPETELATTVTVQIWLAFFPSKALCIFYGEFSVELNGWGSCSLFPRPEELMLEKSEASCSHLNLTGTW